MLNFWPINYNYLFKRTVCPLSCSNVKSYYFSCFVSDLVCSICFNSSLFFCYISVFYYFSLAMSKFSLSLTPSNLDKVFLILSPSSYNILCITTSPFYLNRCSNPLTVSLNSSIKSFFYDNSSAKPWRLILFLPTSFYWRRSLYWSSSWSLLIFCSRDWLRRVSEKIWRDRGRLPFLDLHYPYRNGNWNTPIEEY